MPETGKSEKAPDEKIICLFPGCEREAVPPPKPDERRPDRQGPPPRYCDLEEHNASSTFQELQRLEKEKAQAQG